MLGECPMFQKHWQWAKPMWPLLNEKMKKRKLWVHTADTLPPPINRSRNKTPSARKTLEKRRAKMTSSLRWWRRI